MVRYAPVRARQSKTDWQVYEAKAMLSQVIKEAALKPQVITIRGKEAAVILSFREYQKLARPRQSLYDFIQNSPLRDCELALPKRLPEKMREVSL